jgi:hypothetical protein
LFDSMHFTSDWCRKHEVALTVARRAAGLRGKAARQGGAAVFARQRDRADIAGSGGTVPGNRPSDLHPEKAPRVTAHTERAVRSWRCGPGSTGC